MSDKGVVSTMDIRLAVLCERLRTRETGATLLGAQHPATEEQVREAERRLGFQLPAMLRALYLTVDNGYVTDIDGYFDIAPVGDLGASHSGWRLAPVVVEALRRYPGSYVTLGEDGLPNSDPDGFIHLVMGGAGFIGVMLDGHAGYIYYTDPDADPATVSFGAPSVEDWLERELDAAPSARWRYEPREKLATILEAEGIDLAELVRITPDDEPDESQRRMETSPTAPDSTRETARLREENLGTEAPELSGWYRRAQQLPRSEQRVHAAGMAIELARHQLLRELYTLMDVLEAEQRWAEEHDQPGFPTALALALGELRPLIVADAELVTMTRKIADRSSDLLQTTGHTW